MKNITTKISRRLIIVIFVGVFTAIFPLFIIGVEAQPPIRVGDGPNGLAYDPVNKRMYVTNSVIGNGTAVYVIDTNTNRVIDTNPNTPDEIDPIKVANLPFGIAYDPVNKRMYVTNSVDNGTVSVIDTTTNKVIDTNPNTHEIDPIKVGTRPFEIAYYPGNEWMYVTNQLENTVSVIDTTTNKVIDTNPNTPDEIDPIRVGDGPTGIAYDPVNKRMYVTNGARVSVSVIDTTTNKVVDTNPNTPDEIDPIKVGNLPLGIAYDNQSKKIYVTNRGDGTVSVIDTLTNTVIDTNPNTPEIDPIKVGDTPTGIAYDPVHKRLYVTNQFNNTVSVIDTTTNTVVGSITVPSLPLHIVHDPRNERMYVTNRGANTVSVIDITTNTVVSSPIIVGDRPTGIAYDDLVHKRMYVTNSVDNGTVSVIDTTTNKVIDTNPNTPDEIDPIRVGDGPKGIAYNLDNRLMYVTNVRNGTVSVINTTTNTVIESIRVGNGPTGVSYSQRNEVMYVTNREDDTVSVIDTTTNKVIDTNPNTPVIDPITVGDTPEGIAYDNQNKKIYVTNRGDGTVSVSVIDPVTNTVIGSIKVGDGLRGIAYDPVNKRIYVSNPRDGTVSVINTTSNTVIKSINVGDGLRDIAYDPVNKRMYVANIVDDNVYIIDSATISVIGSIKVGEVTEGIAYDPVNKRMYVTNPRDGTVSVINIWSDII